MRVGLELEINCKFSKDDLLEGLRARDFQPAFFVFPLSHCSGTDAFVSGAILGNSATRSFDATLMVSW